MHRHSKATWRKQPLRYILVRLADRPIRQEQAYRAPQHRALPGHDHRKHGRETMKKVLAVLSMAIAVAGCQVTMVPGTVTPTASADSVVADSLQRAASPVAVADQPADSAVEPDHRPPWAQRPHDGGRVALPPGLAKRDSASIPPGQARKDDPQKAPPGQLKKDERQNEPPGQARKDERQDQPPGQARKGASDGPGQHGKPDQAGQQKAGNNDKAGQQGKPDQAG
ncbi:MAG: hypothetical protein P8Z36_16995, partial [Gemmatimonadota bacterium]